MYRQLILLFPAFLAAVSNKQIRISHAHFYRFNKHCICYLMFSHRMLLCLLCFTKIKLIFFQKLFTITLYTRCSGADSSNTTEYDTLSRRRKSATRGKRTDFRVGLWGHPNRSLQLQGSYF